MLARLAQTSGDWVYLMPVSGVTLTPAVEEEFAFERVTLVTARRLSRVRQRLGIPKRISQLRDELLLAHFLEDPDQVVAVVRQSGKPAEVDAQVHRLVTEALQVLSVSQLGYSKRRINAFPTINGGQLARTTHLCIDRRSGATITSGQLEGKFGNLVLDRRWLNYQKSVFFLALMTILNGCANVSNSWRQTLRRATVLVGQSQTSSDLAHAFLLNMIALEALLTIQGDKYTDALPKRVEAFIGWIGFWQTQRFEDRIRDAYKKRCAYVHDGNSGAVEIADLLFMDDILLNVLMNIASHPQVFRSKDDVVALSDRVAAERVLGLNGSSAKVRPKTLRHVARRYSPDDLRRI